MDSLDEFGTDFPREIGRVARRELAGHGYTRLDQLSTLSIDQLLSIHGVGPKAVRILGEELQRRGSSLAEE